MRCFLLYIILLCVVNSHLIAQSSVEFIGYFESQLMTARLNDQWQPLQANKLRVDISGDISDNVRFGANLNAKTYHGKTTWQVSDLLPESVLSPIPKELLPFYAIPFEDSIELDNAFIEMNLGQMDLTIGKQQISLGSGYAWNPTDIFNTKDLFDPTYEQPGHNAIRADWSLADRMSLMALVSPEANWETSTSMVLAKIGIARFDLALSAATTERKLSDFTQPDLMTFSLAQESENRSVYSTDLNGDLFGLGVWTELAYSDMELSEDFHEWLFGFDYTFETGTYIMAEMYQNTMGHEQASEYSFNDWMRYLGSEQKVLSQDQIYGFVQHPVSDLVNLGVSSIYSVSDGSIALIPTLNWSPDENLEILAYINWLWGDNIAVFNPGMGNGGLARVRVYF